jgi:heme-degrading monooxygenase HmoA
MVYAIFMSEVEDYDKWLSSFKDDAALLKAHGGKSARALQRLDNPNMGIVISEWDNLEDAQKFAESDELRARMEAGGVIGKPEIFFAEQKLVLI